MRQSWRYPRREIPHTFAGFVEDQAKAQHRLFPGRLLRRRGRRYRCWSACLVCGAISGARLNGWFFNLSYSVAMECAAAASVKLDVVCRLSGWRPVSSSEQGLKVLIAG